MKLITLVQVSNAGDEEGAIIAKLLTVSGHRIRTSYVIRWANKVR